MLIGGLLLVWIAYRLLNPSEDIDEHGQASTTFWGAMKTIVIADAVMGLDNVLAVAGASHGSYVLVVLGLLISIPVVIWGSTQILKLVERFPSVIYLGAAVLAWTAAKMMISEPFSKEWLSTQNPVLEYVVLGVLTSGFIRSRRALAL
jgi:YjbE family integral membrane protein